MAKAPDKIPENITAVAQEVLEAPIEQRPAILEEIAKALTRRLLKDNPGIDREVSERLTVFVKAVRKTYEHRPGSKLNLS